MPAETDFMTRDLPVYTDFEDEVGAYGTYFGKLWLTDDAYDWPKLLHLYRYADESGRRIINDVLVYLAGYALPTIVEQAHGAASP